MCMWCVCVVVCGSVVSEVYVCACGVCVWWYVGVWYVRCMCVHVVCACGGMWECDM